MAFISILARSVFSFVLLLILSKITGKRQISQLTFYDYTTAVTIGSIAAALAVEEDVDVLFVFDDLRRFSDGQKYRRAQIFHGNAVDTYHERQDHTRKHEKKPRRYKRSDDDGSGTGLFRYKSDTLRRV